MAQTAQLFQLGMDLGSVPRQAQTEDEILVQAGSVSTSDENKDFFIRKNGKCFAGTHLIIDLWGASRIDDLEVFRQALNDAVTAAKATLLHIHLHHFTPNGGVSGVAVLAESHISCHSWPERGYAAFDVFMCGESEPHKAIEVLKRAFQPEKVIVQEYLRGDTEEAPQEADGPLLEARGGASE